MCGGSLISSDWVVTLPTAVTANLPPDLVLLLVLTTCTLMMLTRRTSRFPELLCTRATMTGTLRMTSVCSSSNLQPPWDPMLELSASPPRMKNMSQEPCVPLPDGAPPPRVAVLPEFSRRFLYLLSAMKIVEMPMDLARLLIL